MRVGLCAKDDQAERLASSERRVMLASSADPIAPVFESVFAEGARCVAEEEGAGEPQPEEEAETAEASASDDCCTSALLLPPRKANMLVTIGW